MGVSEENLLIKLIYKRLLENGAGYKHESH